MITVFKQFIVRRSGNLIRSVVVVTVFAFLGFFALHSSHAATYATASEAEAGALSGNASVAGDASDSGGSSVKFGGSNTCDLPSEVCQDKLVWSDEFDGTSVDTSKWSLFNNSNYGTGNKEDECYYPQNATESGGDLHITAKRETVTCGGTNPDTGTGTYYFTSAFLRSTYNMKQGYVEAAVKMPKGNPFWGGMWLTGGSGAPGWPNYGEFDVTEQLGIYPDTTFGTLHWACGGGQNCQTSPHNYNMANGSANGSTSNFGTQLTSGNFSTYSGVASTQDVRYGFLWESNRIAWYVNDRLVRSFDGTHLVSYAADGTSTLEHTYGTDWYNDKPTDTPFSTMLGYNHLINLNLSVGGSFPQDLGYTGNDTPSGYSNGNLAATFPASMDVDYVRVYQ